MWPMLLRRMLPCSLTQFTHLISSQTERQSHGGGAKGEVGAVTHIGCWVQAIAAVGEVARHWPGWHSWDGVDPATAGPVPGTPT